MAVKSTQLKQVIWLFEKLRTETMLLIKTINVAPLTISLSIGICNERRFNHLNEMINCADDALYKAKEKGRNQIVLSTEIG